MVALTQVHIRLETVYAALDFINRSHAAYLFAIFTEVFAVRWGGGESAVYRWGRKQSLARWDLT